MAADPGSQLGPMLTGIGVAVSLVFNVVNLVYAVSTRSKSLKLDHFNSTARQPIEIALIALEACCDDVERYLRQPQGNRVQFAGERAIAFHTARRNLERRLQDAQGSDLIPGDDWSSLRDRESDFASEALEHARAETDEVRAQAELTSFCVHVANLNNSVRSKMDAASRRLMRLY